MSMSDQLCRRFSLDEIKSTTRNFDEELIIGKGGFGCVYTGVINNGQEIVAIKRLSFESTQGETEFLREIQTLSKLKHENLVRLQGYCNEPPEKILVYEYMPNGTLVDHLYKIKDSGSTSAIGGNQPSRLTWEQRLNICIGAAKGLDFLHRVAVPGVIHRDIKGSNILLDGNFVAKIADFGLAKLVKTTSDPGITTVSTTIFKGTFGYMDPEYFYSQRLTTKTDIYAFGVVLLSVLCGRPAVDNKAKEDQRSLAEWAKKCIDKNKVDLIIDPCLVGKISSKSLKEFVRVSLKCLRRQSEQRPTMEEVVAGLELALKKQPPSELIGSLPSEWSNLRQMVMAKLQVVSKKKQPVAAIADKEKWVPSSSVAGSVYRHDEIIYGSHILVDNFRSVYLGRINNGAELVAIKRFSSKSNFLGEMQILRKLQHDHVGRLKGYCNESSEMILVYEYPAKGNLKNLVGHRGYTRLTWEQRLKICLGVAHGLDFLHRVVKPGFIHRDVNCSNIMLDDNFLPKINVLGISKLANFEDGSTRVWYAAGQMAPEWHYTGIMTTKSDVFSFGVVMLVVLSGITEAWHLCFVDDENMHFNLVDWAVKCIRDNRIDKLIDHHLRGQFKSESLEKFLEVAQNCMHEQPEKRHTMENVVAGLEIALEKQLSSTSTQWVESHELPNLLCLETKNQWQWGS